MSRSNSTVMQPRDLESKRSEESIESSKSAQNLEEDKQITDANISKSHLLSKIQGNVSDYEQLMKHLIPFQLATQIQTPTSINNTTPTNDQFPLQQKMQRHHIVYLDLM